MSPKRNISSVYVPTCRRCVLHTLTHRVCVSGRGNAQGSILLVGEAPGQNEEKTGMIFSGASGQLLQAALKTLGMEDLVYITNTVKCRPPGNRTPKGPEIRACSSYLQDEIKTIRPKVIVCLGRVASVAFGLKTRELNGAVYMIATAGATYPVLLTIHPAYCLRMGRQAALNLKHHLEVAKELAKL